MVGWSVALTLLACTGVPYTEDTAPPVDTDVETDVDTDVETETTPDTDLDGDGYTTDDCDDSDAAVNPDASEVCDDGIDNDCDGMPDPDCTPSGDLSLDDADAVISGESSGDRAGWSVGGAGDVDGDGLDDVIVGAIGVADVGDYSGAAFLVSGATVLKSDTLDLADATARLTGVAEYDSAGYAVSGVGDMDGDGYADLIVGAIDESTVGTAGGAVYIVWGGPDLTGTQSLDTDVTFLSEERDSNAGGAVRWAGDVNGDGAGDAIVGASGANDNGTAYVILGSASLSDGTLSDADARLIGEARGDQAGIAVSGAGDVDGDGLEDVIVGAWSDDTAGSAAGAAYLVLGGSISGDISLADAEAKFTGEDTYDNVGSAVSGVGDTDGDGLDDVLIGAIGAGPKIDYYGGAYLVTADTLSGLTSPLDLGSADARFSGEAENDDAGVSVSGAGDVNGDGNHDLLIAASDQDDGADRGGAVYRILSPVSGTINLGDADARYLCEARGGYAGWGLSDAGDLNGDGLGDVIIGAYGVDLDGSDDGESYIVLGRGL